MVIQSAEQFTTHLYIWHKTVKQRDKSKAAVLREEAKNALQNGDFPDDLWDRFLLLDARLDLLMNDVDSCEEKLRRLDPMRMSDYANFFYYSFLALVKYSKQAYLAAIELLEKAENYMYAVDDEEEHAGLHYNKAMQFYYLDINALSSFHLDKAIALYEKNSVYKKKVANCKSLQGLNQIDLRQFDKAEINLMDALAIAEEAGQEDLAVACRFNIGFMYYKQQADDKGIPYLQQAAADTEHPLYVQALFTLTRSLYITGRMQEAADCWRKGMQICEQTDNLEYRWQFAILQAYYVEHDTMDFVYDSAIQYFRANRLFHLMKQYARDYSQFLWEKEQYDRFHYFHKLSMSNDIQ